MFEKITRSCPKCGKKVEASWMFDTGFLDYSWRRADLPYFLCGDCRVAFVDRKFLRACIGAWRKAEKELTQRISFYDAYKKARESLASTLRYYEERVGYRIVKFPKQKRGQR